MNQFEIAGVRKELKENSKNLTVNCMVNAIVSNNEIKAKTCRRFAELGDDEKALYLKLFKQSLGGKMGKNLLEYPFVADNFQGDNIGNLLYKVVNDELEDDDETTDVINRIANSVDYMFPFYVSIIHCTMNVKQKSEDVMDMDGMDSDDESYDQGGSVFNFIVINICDFSCVNAALKYNERELSVEMNKTSDMVLSSKPIDSIMFPVLNNGGADVNYVMYRTQTPSTPNKKLIEGFLNCKYTMSGEEEKEKFKNVIYETFNGQPSFDVISEIHNQVKQIQDKNVMKAEMPEITVDDFAGMLTEIGCDDVTISKFRHSYQADIGAEHNIKAVNALDLESFNVKMSDVKITAPSDAVEKIQIQNVNGVKSIVINIDDNVQINGISVKS